MNFLKIKIGGNILSVRVSQLKFKQIKKKKKNMKSPGIET
jgi:hypothetical protein